MFTTSINRFLHLAIFRLEDVCVRVQEGMEGYVKTAALEKSPGIEATFRWLRRRGIRVCVLSGYDRANTEILLDRLDWEVGEDGFLQLVILRQETKENPIELAIENAGLLRPAMVTAILDTPRLLQCARAAKCRFVLGVTNGSHTYEALAGEPNHALLDSTLQLPNFLLRHLPETEERPLTIRPIPPGEGPTSWSQPLQG
ncbi:MAG: hypothetical protein AAGF89_17310 [Bacteroidota bacterium]